MKTEFLSHLPTKVIKGIKGFQLDAFLIAYEGWRRGLTLRWYQDETDECKMHRLNSSTSGKFFSLSSPERSHYFFRSRGDKVGNEDVNICRDKEKTKELLKKAQVPIPLGKEFTSDDEEAIINYATKIGFPVVIKPVTGSMGRGVFINIQNEEEFKEVLSHFKNKLKYKKCIVEKHYNGKEYRVYVVGNEAISAINRVPANVVGNGKDSITNLIDKKNKQRKKNPYLAVKPIKIDFEVNKMLKAKGYDEESIPAKDEKVFLRALINLSAGGDPIDETADLTDEVKHIAVTALKALPSIPHAGVDVIVDPTDKTKGVVLEINATAEIAFHSFPLQGDPKDLPAKIIDYYFPETLNNDKTNFYFDYRSILRPLRTWSARLVEVTPPPMGEIYVEKYVLKGSSIEMRFLRRIRREALKNNLHGYVERINSNKVEVKVLGVKQSVIEDFYRFCKKGSKKSIIENTTRNLIEINRDDVFKIGFELIK